MAVIAQNCPNIRVCVVDISVPQIQVSVCVCVYMWGGRARKVVCAHRWPYGVRGTRF